MCMGGSAPKGAAQAAPAPVTAKPPELELMDEEATTLKKKRRGKGELRITRKDTINIPGQVALPGAGLNIPRGGG